MGELIGTHGYWVLFLGCLLEGETVLVLAGFAAHQGYMQASGVIAVASVAGFLGDQFFFWLGRRHGAAALERFPSFGRHRQRMHRLIERYPNLIVIGIRFAYGLRIAGPLLIGSTTFSAARFALLNAIGALLWATLLASTGWVFGATAKAVLGEIRHLEGWLLLAGVLVGVAAWCVHRYRMRRRVP